MTTMKSSLSSYKWLLLNDYLTSTTQSPSQFSTDRFIESDVLNSTEANMRVTYINVVDGIQHFQNCVDKCMGF